MSLNLRSIAILVAMPACLLKPSPPSGETANDAPMTDGNTINGDGGGSGSGSGSGSDGSGSDGSGSDGSGSGSAMVPRVLSVAYYSGSLHNPGTSGSGYAIDASAVQDGDFLLLIGNIDNGNGSSGEIMPPAGFTALFDDFYTGGGGQTYFAAWKFASGEPSSYHGTYMNTSGDQYSAFALLAISGVNTLTPIQFAHKYIGTGSAMASPDAVVTVATDSTSVPHEAAVVAAGADWLSPSGGQLAEVMPAAVHLGAELTDQGNTMQTMSWTSLTVGWFDPPPGVGSLGSNSIHLGTAGSTDTEPGVPWGIVIVVEPQP